MITRWIAVTVIVAAAALAAVFSYRLARSSLAVEVYRDRLATLSADYEQLRQTYNQAVRQTAVTELLVEGGQLCVVVRTREGELRRIATPYDPRKEIYVDYVVLDGRLWIRRVFDARTPPEQGVQIDPRLANVDWHSKAADVGKAIYRSLDEGRWVVTVTGDGSLGLRQVELDAPLELSPPPQVRSYDEIEHEVRGELERVGPGELFRHLVGG